MQFDQLKRRELITLLGGAAAWPLAASAQSAEHIRLVGILNILGPDDPEAQARNTAFVRALQQLGWAVGRDLKIEIRQVGGDLDRLRRYAAELIALAPDVIVSVGSVAVAPLQQATRTIPIVFVNVPDPVGGGYIASLARPGGNATGFMQSEYSTSGKWLELLKEIAPRVTRAVVIRDPTATAGVAQFAVIQSAAGSFGVELSPIDMRDAGEIERGVTAFARAPNGGLIVTTAGSVIRRSLIIALAARHKLPAGLSLPLSRQRGRLDLVRA